jgi:hypothetical protein
MRRPMRLHVATLIIVLTGCSAQPFKTEPVPTTTSGQGPTLPAPPTAPAPGPSAPVVEAPPPAPIPKERPKAAPATLSPASKSLVSQAQAQRKKGDLPGATASLERALRIEPNNPLLWIEMGRLRMDQQNFAQAESLGRKALSMAVGDARTQSAAWLLIADSFRARGKNPQAQQATAKANELSKL